MSDLLYPWRSLEEPPCSLTSSTTLVDWKLHWKEGFSTWRRFLLATDKFKTDEYPCPDPCKGKTYCLKPLYSAPGEGNHLFYCEKRSTVVVTWENLRTYRFDILALNIELAHVLGFDPATEPWIGSQQNIWTLGSRRVVNGSMLVYCILEWEPQDVELAVQERILVDGRPFVLVTPSPRRVTERTRELFRLHQIQWIVLSQKVALNEDGALVPVADVTQPGRESSFAKTVEGSAGRIPAQTHLDLVPRFDGHHWIVNGEDRGVAFHRDGTILARISKILFQQIGSGWIPHRTFINATGWRRTEYFGPSTGGGRMQKQLSQIRRKLGLPVEFNIRMGVRLPENVVNSRNQSNEDFSLSRRQ